MAERPSEPGPGFQPYPGWSDPVVDPWRPRVVEPGPGDPTGHPHSPDFSYPPDSLYPPNLSYPSDPAHQPGPAYPPGAPPAHPSWSQQPSTPWPGAPNMAAPPFPFRVGVQRPAVIGIAASMAITASLMFLVLLGFGLLVAASIMSTFSTSEQPEAAMYHVAERFQLYLEEGLAVPLVGFPLASTVAGFLLIARRHWARIVYTAVGVTAVAWSAWWLRDRLGFWVPTTVYIAIAVLILWLPSVGRWYADREHRADPPPLPAPDPTRPVERLRF